MTLQGDLQVNVQSLLYLWGFSCKEAAATHVAPASNAVKSVFLWVRMWVKAEYVVLDDFAAMTGKV